MKFTSAICIVSLAALVAACSEEKVSPQISASTTQPQVDLQALAKQRIFFGHQSVGDNILEGVGELLNEQGGVLQIKETADPTLLTPGVLAHAPIGTNGDPSSKMRAFARYMDSGLGSRVDVALFKFCYVDVNASTDVDRLFHEYKQTMATLEQKYPSVRFLHATMPLRLVQTGPKATVKRLLGRPAGGYVENSRRNRYNDLLRREYAGRGVVFDLAETESRGNTQTPITFTHEGQRLFALDPAYTPDNGHLNEAGRRAAATRFLETLSPAQRSAGK